MPPLLIRGSGVQAVHGYPLSCSGHLNKDVFYWTPQQGQVQVFD